MKKILLFLIITMLYSKSHSVSEEKRRMINERYWKTHIEHTNKTYDNNKEFLKKFEKNEVDYNDVLIKFKYLPNRDAVSPTSVKNYIDGLYNFSIHDARCTYCFENAKRWYYLNYEKLNYTY